MKFLPHDAIGVINLPGFTKGSNIYIGTDHLLIYIGHIKQKKSLLIKRGRTCQSRAQPSHTSGEEETPLCACLYMCLFLSVATGVL